MTLEMFSELSSGDGGDISAWNKRIFLLLCWWERGRGYDDERCHYKDSSSAITDPTGLQTLMTVISLWQVLTMPAVIDTHVVTAIFAIHDIPDSDIISTMDP